MNNNYGFLDLGQILDILAGRADQANAPIPVVRRPNVNASQGPGAKVPPIQRKSLEQEIADRKARIAEEQRALEEAERQLENEQKRIQYVADDEKIDMLIPREKVSKMITSLSEVIKKEPNADKYHLIIKL